MNVFGDLSAEYLPHIILQAETLVGHEDMNPADVEWVVCDLTDGVALVQFGLSDTAIVTTADQAKDLSIMFAGLAATIAEAGS